MTDTMLPIFDPIITGHCFFFGSCKHTETGTPDEVHDLMEAHYAEAHAGPALFDIEGDGAA